LWSIWLCWQQAGISGYGFTGSRESGFARSWKEALDLTLLPQLRHAWFHHSDMLTLTSLTIWLQWEEAVCGAFWFAGTGETNVAGSMEL